MLNLAIPLSVLPLYTGLLLFSGNVTPSFPTASQVNYSSLNSQQKTAINSVTFTGELRRWHPITLTFTGPHANEADALNPFRDYRLNVTFTKGAKTYKVPGHFAANGDAGNTGASSGNKWKVIFVPDETGTWSYTVSFRTGKDVAVSEANNAGRPISFDGMTGRFLILPTNKTGRDHRSKGLLKYVGKHYLQFAGSGEYFLKGGAGSPENFLAYSGFDKTTASHRYIPHAGDWRRGDPDWSNGKGKNIIGAINYLAAQGMNSIYFLTFNVGGDGDDVFPYTSKTERYRFDVSKLDQWDKVFSHMDRRGIMLHVITQEQENDQLLNDSPVALGTKRKLYYRELISRFGHHLALAWNLGEENTNTHSQRQQFAAFLRRNDPYNHPIVVHTFPDERDRIFTPLLGYPNFEGTSLQIKNMADTHATTMKWVDKSAQTGRKWVVALDEIGPAQVGVAPDAVDPAHNNVRKLALWGNLMAGGAGVEWYFGYRYPNSDLTAENWRSRAQMWNQTRYALQFFQNYLPFTEMVHSDSLTSVANDYCLAKPGQVYGIYLPNGGTTNLNLGTSKASFSVKWYNPRTGSLQNSHSTIIGPGSKNIGNPPTDLSKDWVALIRRN